MSESQKQRLERIAVQILAGYVANPAAQVVSAGPIALADVSIFQAQELIKQLDALPPA